MRNIEKKHTPHCRQTGSYILSWASNLTLFGWSSLFGLCSTFFGFLSIFSMLPLCFILFAIFATIAMFGYFLLALEVSLDIKLLSIVSICKSFLTSLVKSK